MINYSVVISQYSPETHPTWLPIFTACQSLKAELFFPYRFSRTRCHAVATVQTMRLFDMERNDCRVNAVLWTYRDAAFTADARICDEEAFLLVLSAAKGEGSPFDGLL